MRLPESTGALGAGRNSALPIGASHRNDLAGSPKETASKAPKSAYQGQKDAHQSKKMQAGQPTNSFLGSEKTLLDGKNLETESGLASKRNSEETSARVPKSGGKGRK